MEPVNFCHFQGGGGRKNLMFVLLTAAVYVYLDGSVGGSGGDENI